MFQKTIVGINVMVPISHYGNQFYDTAVEKRKNEFILAGENEGKKQVIQECL